MTTSETPDMEAEAVADDLSKLIERLGFIEKRYEGEGGCHQIADTVRDAIKALVALQPFKDELLKIAEDVGEPDPFAAWEVIESLQRATPPKAPIDAGVVEALREALKSFAGLEPKAISEAEGNRYSLLCGKQPTFKQFDDARAALAAASQSEGGK